MPARSTRKKVKTDASRWYQSRKKKAVTKKSRVTLPLRVEEEPTVQRAVVVEPLFHRLFPSLVGDIKEPSDVQTVNLSQLAKQVGFHHPLGTDLTAQVTLVEYSKINTRYTHGGFGEDRTGVWVADTGCKQIHLGEDFNVPAGTPVHSLGAGKVRHVFNDPSAVFGRGGVVLVEDTERKRCVLYCHLDPSSITVRTGETIQQSQSLGTVGASEVNGGWFPHLHVQYMTSEFVDEFVDITQIDNYFDRVESGVLDPNTIP